MTAATTSPERTIHLRVGEASVTLAAGDVTEIVRRPLMIRVPHGPSRLIGLANLRGKATPNTTSARAPPADAPTFAPSRGMWIPFGTISRPHGVRGELRVAPFRPEDELPEELGRVRLERGPNTPLPRPRARGR